MAGAMARGRVGLRKRGRVLQKLKAKQRLSGSDRTVVELLRQVLKGKKGLAIAPAVPWQHSVTGVQGISWEVCIKKMEVQEPANIE